MLGFLLEVVRHHRRSGREPGLVQVDVHDVLRGRCDRRRPAGWGGWFDRRKHARFGRYKYRLLREGGKVVRNDPCWCGSGKKYKKCHMANDRAASAAPPA